MSICLSFWGKGNPKKMEVEHLLLHLRFQRKDQHSQKACNASPHTGNASGKELFAENSWGTPSLVWEWTEIRCLQTISQVTRTPSTKKRAVCNFKFLSRDGTEFQNSGSYQVKPLKIWEFLFGWLIKGGFSLSYLQIINTISRGELNQQKSICTSQNYKTKHKQEPHTHKLLE